MPIFKSLPRYLSLESLLGVASVGLLIQLFPGLIAAQVRNLDVRAWSHGSWAVFYSAAILYLLHLKHPHAVGDMLRAARRRASRAKQAAREPGHAIAEMQAEHKRQEEWVSRAKGRLPWK